MHHKSLCLKQAGRLHHNTQLPENGSSTMQITDYVLIACFGLSTLTIAAFHATQQRTSRDFLLARRSVGGWTTGLSLTASLPWALALAWIPGQVFTAGPKAILWPLAVLLALPVGLLIFVPLLKNLHCQTSFEYLAKRFGPKTAGVAAMLFLAWRLVWTAAMIWVASQLVHQCGLVPSPLLASIVVVMFAVVYVSLGGMKAVARCGIVQCVLIVLVIFALWLSVWTQVTGPEQLDEPRQRVWDYAISFEKTDWLPTSGSQWGVVLVLLLGTLFTWIGDQGTSGRLLVAKNEKVAWGGLCLQGGLHATLVGVLCLLGWSLLAFYQDNPDQMRTIWVLNVDPAAAPNSHSEQLIAWDEDLNDPERVQELFDKKLILNPNNGMPYEDIRDVIISKDTRLIDLNKVAARRPPRGEINKTEILLQPRATNELWTHLVSQTPTGGFKGLLAIAFAAMALAAVDNGLIGMTSCLTIDLHRRLGWGRGLLVRLIGESERTDVQNELWVARAMVVVCGGAIVVATLVLSLWQNALPPVFALTTVVGATLLATFLLGIFTRASAVGAIVCVVTGLVVGVVLCGTRQTPEIVVCGTLVFSLVLGAILGAVIGQRKDPVDVRGLIVGHGHLGVTEDDVEEATIEIGELDVSQSDADRWK